MSKRNPVVLLEDMCECTSKILEYSKGMSFDIFLNDSRTREAIYRNFEVMGEAANRMPEEFKDGHKEIEWKKIIGTRNIIIHAYNEIDDNIVWNIITNIIPDLDEKLHTLKDSLH